ncbi:hypothetical protein [Rhizobium sp. C1]|nr:hypothetical protein [Rhizobium sp. C1]
METKPGDYFQSDNGRSPAGAFHLRYVQRMKNPGSGQLPGIDVD